MKFLRSALRPATIALMALSSFTAVAADKYPATPIRMLVGTPAGGTTDIIARLIASKMEQSLGGSVVVYNKPGASGLIASDFVGKASPDGYTLLMASSQVSTYRALYPTTTFDPEKDLAPIGLVATTPYVMVVNPKFPVKTFQELIAYAKAHPGQISYAGSTPGTAQHLGWEIIKRDTGTDMKYVPYKGTGELMPDLLAGRLQAGIDNVAVLTPYIKSGQLRGIAVTSAEPTPLLPGLPTIASSGVPGFRAMGWFGVFATKNTPPAVLDALRKSLSSVMSSPETRAKFNAMGAEPQSGDSKELGTLLHSETVVWSKVIKESHISFQ